MPPSDTLEALPEGFWDALPAQHTPLGERRDAPQPPALGPQPAAPTPMTAAPPRAGLEPQTAAPPRPASAVSADPPAPGTVAMLQRLFPGRVLRIEPAETATSWAPGADADEHGAELTGEAAAADEGGSLGGLESPRSRDT